MCHESLRKQSCPFWCSVCTCFLPDKTSLFFSILVFYSSNLSPYRTSPETPVLSLPPSAHATRQGSFSSPLIEMVLSRIRPSHRHSVLDLDISSTQDFSQSSPNSSLGSMQSTSSSRISSRSPRQDKISYNSNLLHKLKQSGLRITPEEVFQLRRELQEDFVNQKGHEAKRNFLLNALEVLSELRQELNEEIELKTPDLQFFVFEYQALICWLYSEIRFAPYMSEIERHFTSLKKEHTLLLSALPSRSEPFLLCALRFSHLCLEYAPYCDDESLRWIKIAAERGTGRRKVVSLTIGSPKGSVSSISSNESVEATRREDDYKNQLLKDLRKIIKQIEGAIEMHLGSSQENRVD